MSLDVLVRGGGVRREGGQKEGAREAKQMDGKKSAFMILMNVHSRCLHCQVYP